MPEWSLKTFCATSSSANLRQYYEREGSNEGYILFSDFSGYYANILHDVALAQLEKYLTKEIADPAELEQVMGVLRTTFKTYELDVSRFSDEEIQRMYPSKSIRGRPL